MGDFANGIDMQNNMLSEMQGYNSDIKEHTRVRNKGYDDVITAARGERQEVTDPKELGETAAQLGQTAQGVLGSSTTLKDVYGGSKLAFVKGLGRTGEETSFGGKTLLKVGQGAVRKGGQALEAIQSARAGGRVVGAVPTGSSSAAWGDARPPPTPEGLLGSGADEARFAGADPAATTGELAEGTYATSTGTDEAAFAAPTEGAPVTATLKSGSNVASDGTRVGSRVAGAVAEGAEPSALRVGAGIAGDLVGKAGLGLGILSGGEALMSDIMGGKVQGDDAGEKTGNKLAIAGGALDALGLAIPPLAILGGIAGVASAIFTGEGHLKHAQETAAAATAAKAKPGETPMEVTSMASLGQVASRGTDITHSIAGTSAF